MISGMIVLEDLSISFKLCYELGGVSRVDYTIAGDGQAENVSVDADAFMKALGMALQMDGEPSRDDADFRAAVELAQPTNPALRFIP